MIVHDRCIPCVSLNPITFDDRVDSDETIKQTREYNAIYDVLCPIEIKETPVN